MNVLISEQLKQARWNCKIVWQELCKARVRITELENPPVDGILNLRGFYGK